jgi:hypothetical protein
MGELIAETPESREVTFFMPHPPADIESPESSPCDFFVNTENNWTFQTYQRLRQLDPPLVLSPNLPTSGVIVAFAGSIPGNFRPTRDQYLVSISADGPPCRLADMHIVQNKEQTKWLRNAHFIPHWPQPGLVPRTMSRGERFENIMYFGDPANLAPELRAEHWSKSLKALGLNWRIIGPDDPRLADFSSVDAVVAVRSFTRQGFIRKPASKLVNSWIAGVPAILGVEYAFREVGHPGDDYFEAYSYETCLDSIALLKEDEGLRARIVQCGRIRASAFSVDQVSRRWMQILRFALVKCREKSTQGGLAVARDNFVRVAGRKRRGLEHRVLRMLDREHNSL